MSPPSTPNPHQRSHRSTTTTIVTVTPTNTVQTHKYGQGNGLRKTSDKSTDHYAHYYPIPSVPIPTPAPAPPANISRLQPQHQNQHTLTSGNHNKGLRPLGMSSNSTLNIPTTSTATPSGGKSPTITSSKADRRRSMILPPSPSFEHERIEEEVAGREGGSSSSSSTASEIKTSNKLKRLSLCSRPPSLEFIDHNENNHPSTPITSPQPPSTPLERAGSTRRPDRRMGVRASISYSPAIPPAHTPRTAERKVFGRGDGWGMDEELNMDDGKDDRGDMERSEDEVEDDHRDRRAVVGVQTLAEKHAELLTHIAQRERRVAELKQELLAQENSLAQLKSRWTTIVSRSALSPTQIIHYTPTATPTHTTTRPPQSSRRRPVSMISTSTSTSSASSLSLATIDEPVPLSASALISSTGGLSNTGAAVLSGIISQTEGYLGTEVVQGGKRFLGNLWKTVGAAAGGTVPVDHQEPVIRNADQDIVEGLARSAPREEDNGGEWNQLSSKLDLANLQKLITPWETRSTSATSQPPSSASSSSSAYPSRQRKERLANDRSSTVTPTSFSRRQPSSPPATVGLGFDLNIKPRSTISNSVSSPRSIDPTTPSPPQLLDGDGPTSGGLVGFDDNIGDLGKALTPSKPKNKLIPSKSSSTAASSASDDGWDW
ncbi:hypothetical protein I302_100013 [Kwoniella bestiolae CBS 10118]|uniref:DUF4048 domain-containing protein n=1 Tax=Kwoniella bestiolae CBS 10118 TaxID=1296100 RepID=A0A1B9G3Z0_9TREE|nr:hypothetical protein I302_03385 [Kwoniella bestiolae CBS 10118]OCF25712.1 hypothetical protein I302_03385 [Kwoniella bestiolae CBS 10118]